MLPCGAGIGRLPYAVAEAAANRIASAGVDDFRIGGSDLDGADAIDAGFLIHDGKPGDAGAGGFPDATQGRPDVERAGIAHDTGHRGDASAVEWTNVSPLEAFVEVGIDLRRRSKG